MKLRGDVLKKIRRKRGLSQTALAEGICTQATISLMEKQNRLPKMNILTAICERLNIPTERIVENSGSGINDQFNAIVNELIAGKYETAAEALNKIPVKKLESDFDKQRYYYLLGMVQVKSNKIDEAIFNFELVLTQFATTSANIYLAMTTAGMALAYYKRDDPERAARLTDRAVRLIDNKKLIGSLHQWALIYCQLGELYSNLGSYKDSKDIVERGIELCREHDSLFILDELYLIRGKDELALGEDKQAKETLEIHAQYMGKNIIESDIIRALSMVGLKNTTKKVKDFSLGMRQRLGLARAFLTKPKLLILDEPINGLDPIGIQEIRNLLLSLSKEYGITILISSHILSEISQIADKIGVIKNGEMIEQISMKELMRENIDLEEYFMSHFLNKSQEL